MYVVLTGAKKNLGDFLITERAEALLRHVRPEHELVRLPGWEPLTPHLGTVNEAAAVVILGGPGYQPRMVPGVYPLVPDLDALRPPVIPMGQGWKGFPGDELSLQTYRFSSTSLDALRRFSAGAAHLGCRDPLTVDVLRRHGILNTLMTGCPAWYHLPSLGTPPRLPRRITRVVFTPAQRHLYREQSVQIAAVLREVFPAAERVASFHRGLGADDAFTPGADARNNRALAQQIRRYGFEIADTSGDLARTDFYADSELHVGYRVHAHIAFLSQRKPSVLLHEDGRGRGLSAAIGVPGIDAFVRNRRSQLTERLWPPPLARGARKLLGLARANPDAAPQLRGWLLHEIRSGWARYAKVGDTIDARYEVMRDFLRSLP